MAHWQLPNMAHLSPPLLVIAAAAFPYVAGRGCSGISLYGRAGLQQHFLTWQSGVAASFPCMAGRGCRSISLFDSAGLQHHFLVWQGEAAAAFPYLTVRGCSAISLYGRAGLQRHYQHIGRAEGRHFTCTHAQRCIRANVNILNLQADGSFVTHP